MKAKVVPSAWVERQGRRLDSWPYLSGAIEAKLLLEELLVRKQPLRALTKGHDGGIYNGPQFVRNYVSDPEHGVPFLTSSSMLLVDFSRVDLLRKKDALSSKLAYLRVERGTTLISCSGTIGKMVYARHEMSGIWSSQDMLKIVPDRDAILPGYLYAFLASRYGVPLVVGGAYGAIIQHIEPQHVADLPVPIAPDEIQQEAHRLVEEAAALRSTASTDVQAVVRELEQEAGLPPLDSRYNGEWPDISAVKAQGLIRRMDGLFHSSFHRSALDPLLGLRASRRAVVGDFADHVFEPARFRRIPVEDPQYGVPFFGTSAIMRANPEPEQLIARKTTGIEQLLVNATTILIPRSGQLQGIIGHAVLPHGDVVGNAVTEDAIRIMASNKERAGYLFACLASEYGRRQLKARAFGSSIPHLDVRLIGETLVPRLEDSQIRTLGDRAFRTAEARSEAVRKERDARTLVETWIAQGAA